jgi:hypothetical protein
MIQTAAPALSWSQWQGAVLQLLRADLTEVIQGLGIDDVDWPSWRGYYNEGRTPRAAVNRALERDL